ncbi:hypothetical protein [Butyrivibrio sp. MC2021]|uniref:hypothetical protein n=1 Tax=Butyrivibrio sp. MC2021 TaxID=1408306 RepID=UPI00047D15C7|nr:hypothetical protein [Butyrivibrio sp. MC2021]
MSKASFEKLPGRKPSGNFLDNRKLRLDDQNGTSETVPQRIYIVFSDDVTIEEGVERIEREALSGDILQVSRFDVTGHAAVAVVSPFQLRQIQDLPIIKRIKVMEAHHPNTIV